MDLNDYLKQQSKAINDQTETILKDWLDEVKAVSPKLLPLVKVFVKATKGGKNLRGVLLCLGYKLAGASEDQEIIKIAAALEIFQTAILAHDDIIDRSSERRGIPTVYQTLGGDHYGISQTISLGDVGFFLTNKVIADSNFQDDIKIKALSAFSQMTITTGLGQLLDVELPHKNSRNEKDVLKVHHLKTAHYTIIYPLLLGAILGDGDETLLRQIKVFGENLGIAFQIQDDILGVFGESQDTGKSTLSDIEESKNTLLITQALKKANLEQAKMLNKFYGQRGLTKPQVQSIKKIFIETGALDYSKAKALKYVSVAQSLIPNLSSDPKVQQLLYQMSVFLIERTK